MNIVFNKIVSIFLLFSLVIFSCKSSAPVMTLTDAEKEIKLLRGDQATTLVLMETHEVITTEVFFTHNAARTRAVYLGASVAQLIFTDNSYQSYFYSTESSTSYTYRFWKEKDAD